MVVFSWGRAEQKRQAVGGTRTCHCQPRVTWSELTIQTARLLPLGDRKSAHEGLFTVGWVHDAGKLCMGLCHVSYFGRVHELLMPSPLGQGHHTNSNSPYKYTTRNVKEVSTQFNNNNNNNSNDNNNNLQQLETTRRLCFLPQLLLSPMYEDSRIRKNEGIATKCNASQTFPFPPIGND